MSSGSGGGLVLSSKNPDDLPARSSTGTFTPMKEMVVSGPAAVR
jgi:hypothetical protein